MRSAAVVLVVAAATFATTAGAAVPTKSVTAIAYRVKLGSAAATGYAQAITQSPTTNDVYFAEGPKVLVVKGHAAPIHFVTASAIVLAACATAGALYLVTATSILEYTLPGGHFVGRWALPSRLGPSKVTQAGVAVEGDHLWTWVDSETDESGYQYGSVVQYDTTTWSSRVLAKGTVDPFDAAADARGYFFLANDRVVLAEPNGKVLESPKTLDASDAPVAAIGGTVYLVTVRANSKDYLDTYRASAMTRRSSVEVPTSTYGLLATPNGLLGIHFGSNHVSTSVVLINPTTGRELQEVRVTGATSLLEGTTVSAVAEINNEMYLDRLS